MNAHPTRRHALALAAGLTLLPGLAVADTFPDKPVRLIVPFPPGGGTDILARPVAQKLAERWKQPVVVDNRAGAGGAIGSEAGAQAAPDGLTLVLGTVGTHAINQSLYPKLTFDAVRDTAAVTIVANTPNVLVVHPSVRATSVAELIALAKALPAALNYASPGNGTPPHLAAEVFKNMAGVSLTHVPYRGSGPALADLLGGQVQLMIANAPAVLPYIRNGKLRALASSSARRPASLQDIPTLAETLPGYEADTWYGLFVPAATPAARIAQLNADVVQVLRQPEIVRLFGEQGADIVADSPESAARMLRSEVLKWREVIRANQVKVD
ncbi:tripartite tricarboxylate transporter substrate binding protein [Pseudorhodoferax sp.]|uniref:tripartite tricarboxylate transporter substrate binding protein n=1 Tax=Pseudorhodoferax sp. TaxID=1993553 RepID=UPI002DD66D0E|nr:tripartite tricarboxylate transporter substrate binding protein [Pseudorhodoferax sp.]